MANNTENTGIDHAEHAEDVGLVAKELAVIEDLIAHGVDGDNNPDLAMRRLTLLGATHHLAGNAEQAITKFEQALTLARELYGDKHHDVATLLYNIGSSWYLLSEHEKAIECYEQALSTDRECGKRCPAVARDLNNLGMVWYRQGNYKQAWSCYREAISILKEVHGKYHPTTAPCLHNIGLVLDAIGEPAKARGYYEQATSIGGMAYSRYL